jgi:signal transduction histidine kinase
MKSIRRQMALSIGGAAALLLIGGGAGLHFTLHQTLARQFDNGLLTKAQALVIAAEVDDGEFEIDLDIQAFAGFGSSSPGVYFEVYNGGGVPLKRSPSLGGSDLPRPVKLVTEESGFADLVLPDGAPGRAYWETFTPSDDLENQYGELRILVASDTTQLRRTLRTVALVILSFGGGAILTCLAVLHLVVGNALKPVDRLSADVQHIDVHRLSRKLAVDDLPIELQGVAAKLNESLARLEISFARERRFTSDAAHELRTPLAELRAMTELGAKWPDEFTAEHGREMLEVLAELESLLETLSLLAKADSEMAPHLEPVDLAGSVREALDRLTEDIAGRRLKIDLDLPAGSIITDPVLWRAIVANLLGNAVAYAPESTSIGVSASPRVFAVENEAPDLESGDLDRLFERFWRKSSSRTEKGHSGLGLSVVRAAVTFLGGECSASLEGSRLRVEVRWPGTPA